MRKASFLYKGFTTRVPLAPLCFPKSGFQVISSSKVLEEEQFRHGQFYPVEIGNMISSDFQVIGKLGFGSTSTVWLARNLLTRDHVTLKIYNRNHSDRDEFQLLDTISKANPAHPGYRHVRTALDILEIPRIGGNHFCLVQKPMWESWKELLYRNDRGRFTEELLKAGLRHLFLALDYLHSECKVVHTDIKADNILQDIADETILTSFTEAELKTPSPRKFIGNDTIYASRVFDLPRRFGGPVLSDFGAAVRGDVKRNHDAQPAVYRSPEVMLRVDWSYPIDIWNVGIMIWDLIGGQHLFYGNDPDGKGYSTRAHLAEIISVLGPPPTDLLIRGKRSQEFFAEDGTWIAEMPIPSSHTSLDSCETFLEAGHKDGFLNLLKGMLQWRPEDRKTAKELVEDPWINS